MTYCKKLGPDYTVEHNIGAHPVQKRWRDGGWVTKLKWHNAYGFKLTLCVGHSRMTSMSKEVLKKCVVKKIFETVSPWMDIGVWTICRQNQFSTPVLLRENITFKKDVAF